MNVITRPAMLLEEFLAWEAGQELRWEFDGRQPVAMTGGSIRHSLIQANVIAVLRQRLRGTPCRVLTSDLKVVSADRVRYPDAFVACNVAPGAGDAIRNPVVIFEIISPSTARIDRITKTLEYKAIPSVVRYILLEQDESAATVFERVGGEWTGRVLGADATIPMPDLGIEVALAEFYEDVAFD